TATTWNAQVLSGDALEAVAQLKEEGDGTLLKYGNGPFSRALPEAGLLDEVQMSFSQFVAGSGGPVLAGIQPAGLEPRSVTEIGNGSVGLAYTPVGKEGA